MRIAAAPEVADRASAEYRSIFNAYTRRYHRPRPPIGELAAAQGTITQNHAKRHSPRILAVIDTLLSEKPDPATLRDGIRSLGFDDWHGISPELDNALIGLAEQLDLRMSWAGTRLRGFEL